MAGRCRQLRCSRPAWRRWPTCSPSWCPAEPPSRIEKEPTDHMTQPSTQVTRLSEKQDTSRSSLDELLASTPLATVALVQDGHPVIFPTGFARVGDELVIH